MLTDKETLKSYNPFQIKFDKDFNNKIPAVFLYSLVDEVVPKEHSEQIISHYQANYEKIIMENCPHNENRPKEILQQVFEALLRFEKRKIYDKKQNSFVRHGSIDFRAPNYERK